MATTNQTCDVNRFPSFESLNVPSGIPVGGISARNDTLIAMQKCCAPNPVNRVGECELWCEIPDTLTEVQWAGCTNQYINGAHAVAYRSEGSATTSVRSIMMSVTAIVLLVPSLLS
ncbi:hypothetical protein NUW58_g8882 [Xylaria curta]|uniref:Uncharacterized protein n=1 Tax=Xylaria curta TaxID=42375 RepID=A0ACC1N314_9PEZI|nr:hypothetical protein NUW58_g8882 [Xylaria curta]